jgi:hypothetical protein
MPRSARTEIKLGGSLGEEGKVIATDRVLHVVDDLKSRAATAAARCTLFNAALPASGGLERD